MTEHYKFSLVEEQDDVPSATDSVNSSATSTSVAMTLPQEGVSDDHSLMKAHERVPTHSGNTVTMPITPPPFPPSPFAGMDLPTGTYHPDFMFCGFCATCQEPEEAGEGDDKAPETHLLEDNNSIGSSVSEYPETTKIQLQGSTLRPSQILIIESLLRPLPGINKVMVDSKSQTITLEHDASMNTESVLHALESAGHSAVIGEQPSDFMGDQILVRSKFYVSGICCASEVPAVKKIVKPLHGVSKVQINITTKMVNVQHDASLISAGEIERRLTREGFPTKVQQDGQAMVELQEQSSSGDDDIISTLNQIGRSQFVESTLLVKGLHSYNLKEIEKAIFRSYSKKQVRAIFPNIISETIKVEHDPSLVSIDNVVHTLTASRVDALITIDGGETNMYLPKTKDFTAHQTSDIEVSFLTMHMNVCLSGIFWILSVFSYMEEFDSFKYFGLASVLFGMPPICMKAWRTIRRRQFDANCMMVTAAIGAVALQQFDEAASVAFLFSVSEVLEARATIKARNALKEICDLRPDHANIIHPETKEIVVVPADRVPRGSFISVKTGDKIAADGIVIEGSSSIDESSLTGESVPVHKKKGDEVKGGTINIGTTQLVVKTTTTVEDSAVSRLIRLVEDAQSNRSPTEKLIDAFARTYTPSIMCMAILMCTIPWISGVETGQYWMMNGLIIIVIACPCSLTISTPVTYAAGLAATAQKGIIVKGGAKLEAMGSVDRIVFDKTGTLTKGRFSVMNLEVVGTSKSRKEMLELLILIQGRSSHPISASLIQAAKQEGIEVPRSLALTDHTILKGEGVTAHVNGTRVFVGNQRLFDRLGMFDLLPLNSKDLARTWTSNGSTVGFIGTENDGIIGIFSVQDAIREEAGDVIENLQNDSIDVTMCTGDSNSVAHAVADKVGISPESVRSQLLPEDKLHYVGSLKRPQPRSYALCREKRYVLFCGDGVNDAPALAVADIGCSMGEGAAMAMEMSDVTLMDSNLNKLSYVIYMGRRVLRTVKENILISLVSKMVVVCLTFFGKMTLLLAIASDVGVMLIVTLNGMKLLSNAQGVTHNSHRQTSLRTRFRSLKEPHSDNFEMNSLRDNAESADYFSGQIV